MSIRRGAGTVLITVLLASAPACTAAAPERVPAPVAGTDAPVVVPGAPGDGGRTASPGEVVGRPKESASAADVLFAERMIPHHRQAMEMAGLAPSRTTDGAVLRLCERIAAGQRPEVEVLSRWLRAAGREVPAAHAHPDAPGGETYGMASLEEMNRLRASRGAAFDALLLRLMIRHHEGAVAMAGEELRQGADQMLRKLAGDMASGQRIEIDRMRGLAG
ncbi:DUF305 domain-containing protein [Sphaerisporangium sp. TRM90804]|uniref:DUF305 domain-containing protein n=1 Tax=Sphaerisporangium sp. TRM90804 TaxID=3031113 RepID=UPI002449FF9A|nr:DUF305 domain-containing protein [Sphaerisporangium sp. TRM90804]MDH2427286.1 DUF305 domain-containing protein [Sphaerisporangium sp. TRM90804]